MLHQFLSATDFPLQRGYSGVAHNPRFLLLPILQFEINFSLPKEKPSQSYLTRFFKLAVTNIRNNCTLNDVENNREEVLLGCSMTQFFPHPTGLSIYDGTYKKIIRATSLIKLHTAPFW
jgi:hypothetical protein